MTLARGLRPLRGRGRSAHMRARRRQPGSCTSGLAGISPSRARRSPQLAPATRSRSTPAGNRSYRGDVCAWSTSGLTITGVHGRAHIDAAGANSEGKAIWVIAGNDTTIENVELSGARVPDDNGAGIRQEGAGLTLRALPV